GMGIRWVRSSRSNSGDGLPPIAKRSKLGASAFVLPYSALAAIAGSPKVPAFTLAPTVMRLTLFPNERPAAYVPLIDSAMLRRSNPAPNEIKSSASPCGRIAQRSLCQELTAVHEVRGHDRQSCADAVGVDLRLR